MLPLRCVEARSVSPGSKALEPSPRGDLHGARNPQASRRVNACMSEKTFWQTIETTGDQLVKTVKELIEAGNVRRIRIKQKGAVVAEFPLTVGVVGVIIAPILAAVGALAAVLSECSIEVERVQ